MTNERIVDDLLLDERRMNVSRYPGGNPEVVDVIRISNIKLTV
jgi:hypothetical protein